MRKEEGIEQGLELVNRSTIAILGTNGADGYPNIRAMIRMENEGLKRIWFSANKSSEKVAQLQNNHKTCVYFVDFQKWMGLMLIGTTGILQDPESKQRLWREGFEKYYPQGVNDSDYSVLRFTGQGGKYYYGLATVTFEL